MLRDEGDSRSFLQLENRRRNVFVTQLGEHREEEDKDVTYIPIINESRTQALKFDKFLKDTAVKRQCAVQKYQVEAKLNEMKEREINKLVAELEKLRVRQQKLQKKVEKYKVYEDFLLKITDKLPDNYLEYGEESLVRAIIRRHETLSATNQSLIKNLIALSDDYEKGQHDLEALQREHDTRKLMLISELSELQIKSNRIQEKNKQLELNIRRNKVYFRNQSQELGSLWLAISNLAEQCHMPHYGRLQEMGLLSKLDMIQEYILEKMKIEQLATQTDGSRMLQSSLRTKIQHRKIGATKKSQSQVPAGSGGIIQTPKNKWKVSV
ncbi:PREDICTED: uncharacterized protein LOC109298497 isoform X2 [Gavialis gangeticus]|uniref:uncharacterized protein LOC109298497 isoform X2 n=1 Tax=Gavialis gangeticus TaxID=94835 RepID=UPI00092F286E|nr:PREDICTED: uncharacterized protein LOC109298497 isoform X2 [Gavialis gangeticus]